MPIVIPDKTTAAVYFPEGNCKIVRYLDLIKFVSLIQTGKIYFARLDSFEDKYEGSIPEFSFKDFRSWYENFTKTKLLDIIEGDVDEHVEKVVEEQKEATENFKKLICVSCWNKFDSESYALWKIYSDLSKGVMITTNISRIINAFKDTEQLIQISEIKYIDYKKEKMKFGNMNYPIIHKNIHYNYEKEIRLIHQVNFGAGLTYDWSNEESEYGKYIKVDLNELIDEIVVSPNSPKWFYEIIENLTKTYNLDKNIRFSDLK